MTTTVVLAISVKEARDQVYADPDNPIQVQVTIDDLILHTTTDLINSTSSKDLCGQDTATTTHNGMSIYGENADIDAILSMAGKGDAIDITGYVKSYNGRFEMDLTQGGFSYALSQAGVGVPAPISVTTTDFQNQSATAEGLENKLVTLSGVEFVESGTFQGSQNYTLYDGTNYVTMRVSTGSLDIVGEPIPNGQVTITGVFSQYDWSAPYDGYYQLLIRSKADLVGPPQAYNQTVVLSDADAGSGVLITLEGNDDTDPGPSGPFFDIVQGPKKQYPTVQTTVSGGTLTDPVNSTDVTNGGSLQSNQVRFAPDPGTNGWYAFTFTVNDGENTSNEAKVNLLIQNQNGQVVISELMYNPNNYPDSHWEWVEIKNKGGSTINLSSLFDARLREDSGSEGNLIGKSIPSGSTRVIIEDSTYSRSTADFLNEWNLTQTDLITIPTSSDKYLPSFSNTYIVDGVIQEYGGDVVAVFADDASGTLLDAIEYRDGENNWPLSNNRGSIYVDYGHDTVVGNDDGANWRLSVPEAGAFVYETPETTGPPNDRDNGHPGVHPTSTTTAYAPPYAQFQTEDLDQGNPGYVISLDADDQQGDPLTYIITEGLSPLGSSTLSGAAVGTLTDAVTSAELTTGGALSGNNNQVVFTPASGVSGLYYFGYKASDGSANSNTGYVELRIQSTSNKVIITEIMYNSQNYPESAWEWFEITNPSDQDVDLYCFYDNRDYAYTNEDFKQNLLGKTLGAGETRIVVRGDTSDPRLFSDFLTEWSPLASEDCFTVSALDWWQWPSLNNSGDSVYLFAADGELLDVVNYDDDGTTWPYDDGQSSIYLDHTKTGGSYTTINNDDGTNWSLSVAGTHHAYASYDDPNVLSDVDIGSPAMTSLFVAPPAYSRADFDEDADVDGDDLLVLDQCATAPGVGYALPGFPSLCPQSPNATYHGYIRADFDEDGDIDQDDFAVLQQCFSGSGQTADPVCGYMEWPLP
jgi:hypothetical protein